MNLIVFVLSSLLALKFVRIDLKKGFLSEEEQKQFKEIVPQLVKIKVSQES
jgi:hypothetical protein